MAGKFEPKVPVQLAPPKTDPISLEALAEANGTFMFQDTIMILFRFIFLFPSHRLLEIPNEY